VTAGRTDFREAEQWLRDNGFPTSVEAAVR